MKGSKLLGFQVYLINLGELSWPRLCGKKESPKFEDRHAMSKRKRTSCMFVFVCLDRVAQSLVLCVIFCGSLLVLFATTYAISAYHH
jgi:hypothetical protein